MPTLTQWLGALFGLTPFTLKLVLGELTFASHFQRRPHFALRVILSLVVQGMISVVMYQLLYATGSWIMINLVYFLAVFVLSAVCLKFSFSEPLLQLIPCAVGGYMVEHISTQVFVLVFYKLYSEIQAGSVTPERLLLFFGAQLLVFLIVSWLIWYLFARNATAMDHSPVLQRRLHMLSVVTLLVVLVLSSVRDRFAGESYHLMVITRLFSIFCCVFLLYIRYDILEKGHLEAERAELGRIVAMERKQFEQSRENIELINIKCHDMRHRIDVWERQGGAVDPEEIDEIRQMIDIYDSGIRTGNEVLDTILTERSLYCEKAGIHLSCIADGEKLGFLSTGDLCALFGNAVENAIEAVSRVPDPDDRNISLRVRENRGMLIITVENSFTGDVPLSEGLPQSSKGDEQNHGFGLKSIRNVAEKYGGELSILVDDIFHLTVLIPLPSQV